MLLPLVRHIDVRYKYVNEYVKDGIVNTEFVKSVENYSNIFMKKVSGNLYEKHLKKMIGENPE